MENGPILKQLSGTPPILYAGGRRLNGRHINHILNFIKSNQTNKTMKKKIILRVVTLLVAILFVSIIKYILPEIWIQVLITVLFAFDLDSLNQ